MVRLILLLILTLPVSLSATPALTTFAGKVTDKQGQAIPFATVYLKDHPEEGTATNTDGKFVLQTTYNSGEEMLIVSFVGYEKQFLPLSNFAVADTASLPVVMLTEQPIALEETVVEAKRTRKSKRKLLAQILRATYMRLIDEQPEQPIGYEVVSDVKLDAQSATWGMEQMIAQVIEQASAAADGSDTVQFVGRACKRYCPPMIRQQIDSLYNHEKDANKRRMASAVDSGTVVHRALWKMRLQKEHLLDLSDELRRWKMSAEDNTRCVLTYTRKHNYLGILKAVQTENLIVDAYDFSLQSYTVSVNASLFLPFSIRLKGAQLEWLNLFNIGNETIEKFRLKRGELNVKISTLYREEKGLRVPYEKNLVADGYVEDRKKTRIPIAVQATQQVTQVKTEGVTLKKHYRKSAFVERISVPIY